MTKFVYVWVVLPFLLLSSQGAATSPHDVLGLDPVQFEKKTPAECAKLIQQQYHRMMMKFHPDIDNGLEMTTKQLRARELQGAREELENIYVEGKMAGKGDFDPTARSQARRNQFRPASAFTDIFATIYNDGVRIFRQMESEYQANTDKNASFVGEHSDSVYQALYGGGFGDKKFLNAHPATSAAFLEFLDKHLYDLLDPLDRNEPSREQIEAIIRTLKSHYGSPADLVHPLESFLKSNAYRRPPSSNLEMTLPCRRVSRALSRPGEN